MNFDFDALLNNMPFEDAIHCLEQAHQAQIARQAAEEAKRRREADPKRITDIANRALTNALLPEDVGYMFARYIIQNDTKGVLDPDEVGGIFDANNMKFIFDNVLPIMHWAHAKPTSNVAGKRQEVPGLLHDDDILRNFLNSTINKKKG